MAFLNAHDVQKLLDRADQVINPEDIFPVDGGVVLRRHVGSIESDDSQSHQPFIQWFHHHVIRTLLENTSQQLERLPTTRRVHVLAGRAGQGKSTLMRHAFLHVKRQWDEENPRIQPNFGFDNEGNNLDDSFTEFYQKFVDRTHYIQARNVGPKQDLQLHSRGTHLVLFDGIDEADEENLAIILEFIEKHPQCVFLLSSRTRRQPSRLHQDHEEIINLNRFRALCDENALRKHAAMLHPMDEREKKDMLRIMEEHEPEREFSFLKTLVENNSKTLQVPADFLLYRAKSPQTKSEYYLHHLRWLIDREDSKDVEERQRLVSQFHIPLQSELSFERLSNGRIYIRMRQETDIEPYNVFNLIESEAGGKSTRFYLDLDAPSSRALLILSVGGISAEVFLEFNQSSNLEMAEVGKNSINCFFGTEYGQELTSSILQEILNYGPDCRLYNCLTSILNGYEIAENNTEIINQLKRLDTVEHNQLDQAINYLYWLIDVIHPIDELQTGFATQELHPLLSSCLEYLIQAEETYKQKSVKWLETRLPVWFRLILRLAQFGPGISFDQDFSKGLIHGFRKKDFFYRFQYLVFEKNIAFIRQTRQTEASAFYSYFESFEALSPREYNTKSKQRIFITCCFLLGFGSPPPASVIRSKSAVGAFLYNTLVQPLLHHSTYPATWPVEHFINSDNPDLIFSQVEIMGDESHDRAKIIDYFLNIGLNPGLNYFDPNRRRHRDYLLKSLKFLNLVQNTSFNSTLSSIINAYGLISRMGHIAPPHKDGGYEQTTLSMDIWKLLWESDSSRIYDDYNQSFPALLQHYPSDPPLPPVFHEILAESTVKGSKKFDNNLKLIKKLYKKRALVDPIDYSARESLRLSRINKTNKMTWITNEWINNWLELSPAVFIENYCAFSSIIHTGGKKFGKSLVKPIQAGIQFWIERGQYLLALILSLRTNRVDVVSILLHAVLDHEDGFHQPQNRLIGNYLHRRVYSNLKAEEDINKIQSDLLENYSSLDDPSKPSLSNIFPGPRGSNNIEFFIDKSMNFKLQSMDEINDFGPTTMLVEGKQYRKARIFLESPPRFYRQAKPWDGGIFYNIEGQDDSDKWQPYMKWNGRSQKYTKYKIQYSEFRKIMKKLFPGLDALPMMYPAPKVVGDNLSGVKDNDMVLRSWHTMPYFSNHTRIPETRSFCLNALKDIDLQLKSEIIEHFTQDEHLATGMSFIVKESPFSDLDQHTSAFKGAVKFSTTRTGGFYNIIVDDFGAKKRKSMQQTSDEREQEIPKDREQNKKREINTRQEDSEGLPEKSYTLDLRTHPAGIRTVIEGWKHVFGNDQKSTLNSKPVVASTFLASLRYAHRIPGSLQQTQYNKPMWLKLTSPLSGHSNPVYGYKFAFSEANTELNSEHSVEGLCEFSLRTFSSSKPRTVITTIIESNNSWWKTDNRFAHPSWKSRMLESQSIQELLQNEMNVGEDSIGKSRTKRAFGIVVDHGRIDEYKLDCIDEAMDKVEQNLEQLRKKERVIAGRENLVNAIREFSVTYLHCDWLPSYLEAFSDQKNRMESIMQAIETEERNQMGQSLEGTVLDFTTIRAMLDGLEYKANKLHSEIEETFESTLEMLNSVTFDTQEERERQFLSLKKTIRRLCLYLNNKEKFFSLRDAMNKAFPNMPLHEISRHCRPRRRLKVRVLGMPQDKFPYAILTSWDEVVGSLWQDDPSSCQVGTLVRLDIKPLRRAGNSKVIVTNIAAAVDELDENGQLREVYAAEWPKTLQHTDTLPLSTKDEDVMRSGAKNRFTVPLYIKRTRAYACHPELNIDLPIFDSNSVQKEFAGQLRTCTVDVRRDRRHGLFRYYVVDVA